MDNQILYEDDSLLIVIKEAGLPTQNGLLNEDSLLSNLQKERPQLFLIHRLDQGVGGLLVFAKTSEISTRLTEIFANNSIIKEYYAIVHTPINESGVLENYIKKNPRSHKAEKANGPKDGKLAKLSFEVVKQSEEYALLKVKLHTGRFHQIRFQFSEYGHPLVGDHKYGSEDRTPIGLYCYHLSFVHPKTKQILDFQINPCGKPWDLFF